MRANLKALEVAALLAMCFGAQTGHAGPVGPLTTFSANTTAKASEVTGNFSAVRTAVDDNAARITTLETTVAPAGNIVLGISTATAGNVLKGAASFIHNFGTDNTFIGENAGNFTMTGNRNTASGVSALLNNTTGAQNTAGGMEALLNNTTGINNTANGVRALMFNTTGSQNTASGVNALVFNTTGTNNTASGMSALANNTTGTQNTASGAAALLNNTIGNDNTASGGGALVNNSTGINNTASGRNALQFNTTGNNNIAIGGSSGSNLTTGDDNIAIGNLGKATESSTIRIGNVQTRAFIAGIRDVTTGNFDAVSVFVDNLGQLGTVMSSRRFKDDIADMGEASSTLMKLRPVTFHYKTDKNPKGRTLQYGLVAEDVAKVAPGLVAHSANGKVETVYYQFLAPMLLNEYQKQQRTIQAQAAELAKQTAKLEKQAMAIAELRHQATRIAELEKQAARMTAVLGRLEQTGMIATAGR
jgi:hypothetical protein